MYTKINLVKSNSMAPHSSTLAWKIPWMEEPGGLQSMGSLRVGHNQATSLSLSCTGEGNGNPLQCSCLENPRDGGAWWAVVYGVAQSRTRLKRLRSSSSSNSSLWTSLEISSLPEPFSWLKDKKLTHLARADATKKTSQQTGVFPINFLPYNFNLSLLYFKFSYKFFI